MINQVDPHSYAEGFIGESVEKSQARTRGAEVGAIDVTPGVGSYLRHLAHILDAQSVVEIGTGSGVGALWVLEGMLPSGTLTSIDGEQEHSAIAKIALQESQITQSRYRLITNPAIEVMTKLADRAYDLVIFRDNAEDLPDAIIEAYRILRDAGKILKSDTEKWVTSLIPVGDGLLLATKL